MNFMMKICKNVKVSRLNTVRKMVFPTMDKSQCFIPEGMDGSECMLGFSQILVSTGNVQLKIG